MKLGDRFGRLVIIKETTRDKFYHRRFICKCDCGNIKIISSCSLRGNSSSCGCYQKEWSSKKHKKHGHCINNKATKEYRSWTDMISRCYNENHKSYNHYGGRGIKVCFRWRYSFENFLEDMGEKPYKFTLDRINNNGNYNKKNCRWADWKTQLNNKRNNLYIEFDGEIKTLTQWADFFEISPSLLWEEVVRKKQLFEDSIIKLVHSRGGQ